MTVTGLEDDFCRALQEDDLDSYVVNLMARLGGLVVLRDLPRDANWEALEKEPSFGRLRRVLLQQHLHTAVGISLQTKQRVFGVLLLGAKNARTFTAAERRLLLALGHQIGMAVENSYLTLQNTLMLQKVQEQATTDGLTGVKSHRSFVEALSAECKNAALNGSGLALILLDLDHFKAVNDSSGHLEGDSVLRRVGEILQQRFQGSHLAARYGGDEFAILLPRASFEQTTALAEKLRETIARDTMLAAKGVTGSLGVATFPTHGFDPEALIAKADASMYDAKHRGGNAVSWPELLLRKKAHGASQSGATGTTG